MDAARNALIRTGEFAPDFHWYAFWLAVVDLLEGQPAKALGPIQRISTRSERGSNAFAAGMGLAQHDLGHARESDAALEELIRMNAGDSPYQIARGVRTTARAGSRVRMAGPGVRGARPRAHTCEVRPRCCGTCIATRGTALC